MGSLFCVLLFRHPSALAFCSSTSPLLCLQLGELFSILLQNPRYREVASLRHTDVYSSISYSPLFLFSNGVRSSAVGLRQQCPVRSQFANTSIHPLTFAWHGLMKSFCDLTSTLNTGVYEFTAWPKGFAKSQSLCSNGEWIELAAIEATRHSMSEPQCPSSVVFRMRKPRDYL